MLRVEVFKNALKIANLSEKSAIIAVVFFEISTVKRIDISLFKPFFVGENTFYYVDSKIYSIILYTDVDLDNFGF